MRFHARRGQISAVGMALDLIAQFLANPTQAPDSRCIGEMKMEWALPEESNGWLHLALCVSGGGAQACFAAHRRPLNNG